MRRWLVMVALSLAACGELPLPVLEDGAVAVDAGPYHCSPMTCPGCCLDNVCRTGAEKMACGYDGRACRECGKGTSCLSPGTCVSDGSDAGTARPFNPDAGIPTNPFTGQPLGPMKRCIFIFGGIICEG